MLYTISMALPVTSVSPVSPSYPPGRFLSAALGRRRNPAATALTQQLAAISAQVKSHEETHLAVLGGAAGSGISYTYITAPDGSMYKVGGSIKVDLQPVPGNPQATLRKARIIRIAALAVGNPSAADMRIAAQAYRMEQDALRDIAEEQERAHEKRKTEGVLTSGSAEQGEIAVVIHRSELRNLFMPPEVQTGKRLNILV